MSFEYTDLGYLVSYNEEEIAFLDVNIKFSNKSLNLFLKSESYDYWKLNDFGIDITTYYGLLCEKIVIETTQCDAESYEDGKDNGKSEVGLITFYFKNKKPFTYEYGHWHNGYYPVPFVYNLE